MVITRRSLLTIAGLTVGVATLTTAAPAAAATPDLEPLDDHALPLLTGVRGALSVRPRQLGVRIGSAVPAGTTVELSYDSRLFAALPTAIVVHDGRQVRAVTRTSADDRGRRTTTVTIEDAVPVGGLAIVAATAYPLAFPDDLVPEPIGAGTTMHATTRTLQPRRPATFPPTASPWGVELYATWRKHVWGDHGQFHYYLPVRVTLRGSGPAPAPGPAGFTVTADPRLLADVHVVSARLNHGTRTLPVRPVRRLRTGTTYRQWWQTEAHLGEGDILAIEVRPTPSDPPAGLATITHPVVSLWNLGRDPAQRHTGHTSTSRQDAVWQ